MTKSTMFLVIALLVLFCGCKKAGTDTIMPTTVTLLLTPGQSTVWYDWGTTIIYSTTGTEVVKTGSTTLVPNPYPVSNIKGDSVYSFTANKRDATGALLASSTQSITLHAYSKEMSLLCNYGNQIHMTFTEYYYEDSAAYPSAHHPGVMDYNTYQYYTNGSGYVTHPDGTGGFVPNAFTLTGNQLNGPGFLAPWTIVPDPSNPHGFIRYWLQPVGTRFVRITQTFD